MTSPCAFLQPTARPLSTALAHPSSLLPGERIGVWRIDASLGGPSYAVTRIDSGHQAVLYEIDAPPLVVGSYGECLRRVLERVRDLHHPGIAELYDAGTLADGTPYIVLEKLDGVTLSLRVAEGRLSADDAIEILLDICAPLAVAHAAGVAHRGLALENVLLVEDDRTRVKLLDWGISVEIAHEARQADRIAWTTPATPPSYSPEDDIRALADIAMKLLHDEPPVELDALIQAMRDPDPRERPNIGYVTEYLEALHLGPALEHLEIPPARCLVADEEPESARPDPDDEVYPEDQGWRVSVAAIATVCIVLAIVIAGLARARANTRQVPPMPPPPVHAVTPTVSTPAPPPIVKISAAATIPQTTTPTTTPTSTPKRADVRVTRARPRPPVTAQAPEDAKTSQQVLIQQFQRVGHELLVLQQQAGDQATAELWPKFRAIDLDAALVTPQSRKAAIAQLAELHAAATAAAATAP